jgi:DNA polymerase III epsilon subunit-like protein
MFMLTNNQTAKYLILDTETTGLNPFKCGLIQVGAIVLDAQLNKLESFVVDVQPTLKVEISYEALQINGFTVDRIQKGISYQDFSLDFLSLLQKHFYSNKAILVGQFLPFDYSFLWQVYSQTNLTEELSKYIGNDFIDTKALVNTMNLKASMKNEQIPFPITSLSKKGGLKDKLKLNSDDFVSHDALGDCLATREVLIKLLQL